MEWIYCSDFESLTVLPACVEAPGLQLLAMKHLFSPIISFFWLPSQTRQQM